MMSSSDFINRIITVSFYCFMTIYAQFPMYELLLFVFFFKQLVWLN